MTKPERPAALALTMGEPAGIGAEIAVAAWRALRNDRGAGFFAIDDPDRLRTAGAPVVEITSPDQADAAFAEAMPVLPEPLPRQPTPGRPDRAAAAHVVRSIERAAALARAGEAGGVVTLPIDKKALYDGADFAHPGHTEFLAALGGVERSVMMLASPILRVVPVTIHIALREAPDALTPALLEQTLRITHQALRSDFDIETPRLAVAGLNPHAGEGGAMGEEEITVIAPVLEKLRAEGLDLRGPLPADTMFHERARRGYDAAICMYHDQALIPIKALDFDRGVNVTLGLPFIRTSPDHGVAYDIAGTGRASPESLIAAIRLAAEMAARRAGRAARLAKR